MEWEIVYDDAGNAIGKKKKKADKGFVGNLVSGLLESPDRLVRGAQQAIGDKIGITKGGGGTQFQSDSEKEAYKNPFNIAKDVAGTASWFVPVGGIAKGATGVAKALNLAKAGAKAGTLQGLGSTYGKDSIEDTITGTLEGAAGGAVGGVAMPAVGNLVGKFSKAVKPGAASKAVAGSADDLSSRLGKAFSDAEGSFEKGIGKRVKNTFQDMRGAELDVSAGRQVNNTVQAKRQTQNILDTLGESQDINGIVRGKQKLGDLMDSYIDEIYKANPKQRFTSDKIFNDDFINNLDNFVDLNKQITPEKLKATAARFLGQNKFGTAKDIVTREMTIGDVKNALVQINQGLKNGKFKGVDKDVAEIMKDRLYETIGEVAPKYKDVARSYAVLASNEKATSQLARSGDRSASESGLFGLQAVLPVSQIKNKVTRGIGNAVAKTGEIVGKGLPKSQGVSDNLQKLEGYLTKQGMPRTRIAEIVGSRAMLEAFDADGNGELDPQEQAMADEANSMYQLDMGGEDAEVKDRYDQAFQAYLQVDGDPIKARQKAAALTGYDPEDEGSEETAKAKDQKIAINQSLKRLDGLAASFQKKGGDLPFVGNLNTLNPFDAEGQAFDLQIKAVAQSLGKALEGGKMTDADREFYMSFLPNRRDTRDVAVGKINQLKEMITGDLQAY